MGIINKILGYDDLLSELEIKKAECRRYKKLLNTRLLSVREVAYILGTSVSSINQIEIKKKTFISHVKIGGARKYKYAELLSFIESNIHSADKQALRNLDRWLHHYENMASFEKLHPNWLGRTAFDNFTERFLPPKEK